jgi:hypothetical protein
VSKCTYQERYAVIEILLRLDIDGPPHQNPDGVDVPCPHLHVYREGYGAKWAMPLPADFTNPSDLVVIHYDRLLSMTGQDHFPWSRDETLVRHAGHHRHQRADHADLPSHRGDLSRHRSDC